MVNSVSGIKIEKLGDNNYATWKRQIKAFMKKEGTWSAVDGIVGTAIAYILMATYPFVKYTH